jgi:hypothetical protein
LALTHAPKKTTVLLFSFADTDYWYGLAPVIYLLFFKKSGAAENRTADCPVLDVPNREAQEKISFVSRFF